MDIIAKMSTTPSLRASELLASALGAMTREPRDRALATELVYGVLRWRLQLESLVTPWLSRELERLEPVARALLLVGAYQIAKLDRIPPEVAVSATQDAARALGADRVTGLVNAVLRKVVAAGPPPESDDLAVAGSAPPPGDLTQVASLPRWMVDELVAKYGADARVEALALKERAQVTLRPTLGKGGVEAARAALAGEGFEVEVLAPPLEQLQREGGPARGMLAVAHGDVFSGRAFHDGLFVAQDPASLAVVDLLAAAQPGPRVLDLCAGRGVKTTALLDLGFKVTAVDIGATKLAELERVARRLGLEAGLEGVHCADAAEAPLDGLGFFDAVLVDAPCSGLGTLRRHPEIAWRMAAADIDGLVALQGRLLAAGAARVAPGGLLVYAVCTFVGREGNPTLPSGFHEVGRLDVSPSSLAAHGQPGSTRPSASTSVRGQPGTARPSANLDAFQAIVLRRGPV